jgi:hypothetical protein
VGRATEPKVREFLQERASDLNPPRRSEAAIAQEPLNEQAARLIDEAYHAYALVMTLAPEFLDLPPAGDRSKKYFGAVRAVGQNYAPALHDFARMLARGDAERLSVPPEVELAVVRLAQGFIAFSKLEPATAEEVLSSLPFVDNIWFALNHDVVREWLERYVGRLDLPWEAIQ